MIKELQTYSSYEAVSDASDSVKLLILIKLICYTHQVKTHKPLALIKAEKTFITSHQAIDETNISYLDRFENMYTVYTISGGEVAGPGMISYDMERPGISHAAGIDFNTLASPEQDAFKARARMLYVSTLYVENSNEERYGYLKTQLANNYTLGTSNFPATLK